MGCRCVVLTGTGLDRAFLESIEAGAAGFVTKDQRFDEVLDAVLAASRGEVRFPSNLLARVLPELRRGSNSTWRLDSPRAECAPTSGAGEIEHGDRRKSRNYHEYRQESCCEFAHEA